MGDLNEAEVALLQAAGYSDVQIFLLDELERLKYEESKNYSKMGYGITCDVTTRLIRVVSDGNRYFKQRCGLHYKTFMREVVRPLEIAGERRRVARHRKFVRRCQLPMKYRIFRTLCRLRNETLVTLSDMSGQAMSTVNEDTRHIVDFISDELTPLWVRMPLHTSEEYECLRGAGDFSAFANVPFSADCTIVITGKPVKNQSHVYHGGKHRHCYMIFTMVDGFGQTRHVAGAIEGNEGEMGILDGVDFFNAVRPYVFYFLQCYL